MTERGWNRFKLIALALLFFAPFIAAWLIYFGPAGWLPEGRTAHGELVDPARPLPPLSFRLADGEAQDLAGKWTILHLGGAACGEDCQHRLWQTRQLRTLLHRRRGRVQRAYLAPDNSAAMAAQQLLAEAHPRLLVLSLPAADRKRFQAWLGDLPVRDPVLLIDPLGNFLMYYGDELPLDGMLSDIKRLLKLSSIG